MKIETMEDKVLAEGIDNRIVDGIGWISQTLERVEDAQNCMENISLELPLEMDKLADEIIDELDALKTKLRKARRDWAAESIKYEDAINEYDARNAKGGRKHAC